MCASKAAPIRFLARSNSLARTPSLECAFGVPGNRALIAGTRTPAPAAGQVGVFAFAVDAKFSFVYVLTAD